jgi:hypothetical protein
MRTDLCASVQNLPSPEKSQPRPHIPSNSPHLAYKLKVPHSPGEAQHLFRVEGEGELILSIKVRERGSLRGAERRSGCGRGP